MGSTCPRPDRAFGVVRREVGVDPRARAGDDDGSSGGGDRSVGDRYESGIDLHRITGAAWPEARTRPRSRRSDRDRLSGAADTGLRKVTRMMMRTTMVLAFVGGI